MFFDVQMCTTKTKHSRVVSLRPSVLNMIHERHRACKKRSLEALQKTPWVERTKDSAVVPFSFDLLAEIVAAPTWVGTKQARLVGANEENKYMRTFLLDSCLVELMETLNLLIFSLKKKSIDYDQILFCGFL